MSKNIVFLTMSRITDIERRGIYSDLLRMFRREGWGIYIVTPHERSLGMPTELVIKNNVHILGVKTLNLQKTTTIEKGIGQLSVEFLYKNAIKKYLKGIQFDLIIYSTPPITFPKVISILKKSNPSAKTYLLLKDIFPQNAVDIGMMTKTGVKGLLYSFFRKKEKKLYALSDYIGCMSPANVEYVLNHNPEIDPSRVEVAPNSVELTDADSLPVMDKSFVRAKYGLPTDKIIFIYGGNLGKPQGVDFLIKCMEANARREDCFFLVVGNGTEYGKLKAWHDSLSERCKMKNEECVVRLMQRLPKEDYDMLVQSCDVGLIFLDHRFTIPNYPSRLLSYLEYRMPVLCATDPNTDMGRIAEENGYGFWCESNDVNAFTALVDKMLAADRKAMGENGYVFLCKNYLVENTYNAIMKHFE